VQWGIEKESLLFLTAPFLYHTAPKCTLLTCLSNQLHLSSTSHQPVRRHILATSETNVFLLGSTP
jgi:hypothetical protein